MRSEAEKRRVQHHFFLTGPKRNGFGFQRKRPVRGWAQILLAPLVVIAYNPRTVLLRREIMFGLEPAVWVGSAGAVLS